jgi:hypothetical protein
MMRKALVSTGMLVTLVLWACLAAAEGNMPEPTVPNPAGTATFNLSEACGGLTFLTESSPSTGLSKQSRIGVFCCAANPNCCNLVESGCVVCARGGGKWYDLYSCPDGSTCRDSATSCGPC